MVWIGLFATTMTACAQIIGIEDLPVCGNGKREASEACDDGNALSGDGCDALCLSDETCGNGYRDPGEVCDDGNTWKDDCSADCSVNRLCGNANVPTIHFLIDHSGSMDMAYLGQPRIDVVREALFDSGGVMDRLNAQVRLGASLFTNYAGESQCPYLTSVTPALNNFDAVDDNLRSDLDVDSLGQDDATAEALEAVAAAFPDGCNERRIIVLVTDGQPDTCEVPENFTPVDQAIARERVELAAQRVFDELEIEVFVFSVGLDESLPHLQRLANAGIGKAFNDPVPAPLYQAMDPEVLYQGLLGTVRDHRL